MAGKRSLIKRPAEKKGGNLSPGTANRLRANHGG